MANHFVKASFVLTVTEAEGEVLRKIEDATGILDDSGFEQDELAAAYAALGESFTSCFPSIEADPFGGFRAIFSDLDYPRLSFSLQVDPSDGSGRCKVWFYGDQVDVETAALLIQATAKSALPFGFEYALDCDRLRPGEFGGGYVVIREDGLEFAGSSRLLDRAIARGHHEGVDGYVLVTRDAEAGLLFWNSHSGFGSLAGATVFSEAEAANFDPPIADDQPEWLALPAPLN